MGGSIGAFNALMSSCGDVMMVMQDLSSEGSFGNAGASLII